MRALIEGKGWEFLRLRIDDLTTRHGWYCMLNATLNIQNDNPPLRRTHRSMDGILTVRRRRKETVDLD